MAILIQVFHRQREQFSVDLAAVQKSTVVVNPRQAGFRQGELYMDPEQTEISHDIANAKADMQ